MTVLRKTKPEHWVEGLYWLLLNSLFGLLPIWGTWLFLSLFSQPGGLDSITKKGELAIYSASVLSAGVYIVTKNWGRNKLKNLIRLPLWKGKDGPSVKFEFPGSTFFLVVSFLLFTVSLLVFVAATFANIQSFNLPPINTSLLTLISSVIFISTLIISYIIAVLDFHEPDELFDYEIINIGNLKEFSYKVVKNISFQGMNISTFLKAPANNDMDILAIDDIVDVIRHMIEIPSSLARDGKYILSKDKEELSVFQQYFVEDKEDLLSQIISNYLTATSRRWLGLWNDKEVDNIFIGKNRFRALLQFMPMVYQQVQKGKSMPSESDFWIVLNKMDFRSKKFSWAPYKHGHDGEEKLLFDLKNSLSASLSK